MLNGITYKDTDVLIVGGGIAGCMAAIRASELGIKATILEKGNTLRSGGAATGIDHCWTYIPEIHGKMLSLDDLVDDHTAFAGGMIDRSLVRLIAENSYQRVLDLERFGVPMRDENGQFRLIKKIHRAPTFLHFAGRDLKVTLTNEARKRGAIVDNRMMVTDLLAENGRVAGALALATREGRWYAYRSKAVIIATGGVFRLYRNPSGMPFNISHPPHETGDGHAMAFRVGARLLNMEMVGFHTGPKNFHRAGRGSYVPGRMRDGLGQPLGKEATAHDQKALDRTAEGVGLFRKILEAGRGPIYMDCTGNTPEQNQYIRWALYNEGNTAFLNYLDEEGIDLNKHLIEFAVYEPKISGGQSGIEINTRCESSLAGLFAAGDVIGGMKRSVCPGALVMGWIAGENAARLSRELPLTNFGEKSTLTIRQRIAVARSFQEREMGSTWLEAQLTLQNIMDYYAGNVKSETLLQAGLKHLLRLRERALAELKVVNPHELFRAMEVLNLMDVGEMLITASLMRKESRGVEFFRSDYPDTDNENWLKFISLEKKNGHIVVGTRPVNFA